MDARLIEKVELGNGLVLEIWDESRKLVGDRWVVTMMARIEIPIHEGNFQGSKCLLEKTLNLLGDRIFYIQRKTRNFIPEKDVQEVFRQIKERFLETTLEYLSRPYFAIQFIKKNWEEIEKHSQWGEEYLKKDLEALKGYGGKD